MFIVFEGIDGCGKGTQIELAVQYMRETFGAKVKAMKYPDRTTPIGRIIDGWLKGGYVLGCKVLNFPYEMPFVEAKDEVNGLAMQALLLANKMEVQPTLLRWFERGHVLADRYSPSGVCYGAADGLDVSYLYETHHKTLFQPDLYVLLDVPVSESFKRRPDRAEQYECDRGRLDRARKYYHWMSRQEPERWEVLDGTAPVADIQNKIRDVIDRLYELGV